MNSWPGIEAAARLRQWPRIVELSERVVASPDLAALLIVGSFARGEADALSDVDFIVVVEHGHFEDAWTRRHDLHPIGSACWDYPRPDEREVAAHRWLTPELVLFDGLISGVHGARVSEPLVVLVGDPALPHQMARFDPGTVNGAGIEVHEIEQLYGRLKLAARVAVGG